MSDETNDAGDVKPMQAEVRRIHAGLPRKAETLRAFGECMAAMAELTEEEQSAVLEALRIFLFE